MHTTHIHTTGIHTRRPMALPAYFLGRPTEKYRRRYRRVPASITVQS